MDEVTLDRYALALALIPDADIAGDLFMDAHSETDLLRRANRWRAQNDLDPVGLPVQVPALTELQCEHGLYLASRAARRRRLRRVLAGCFALAAIVAVGALGLRATAAVGGLSADPVFAGEALGGAEVGEGRKLNVYKAQSTGLELIVWWELRGPSAREVSGTLLLEAQPEGADDLFVEPEAVEVTHVRRDRVLGKSTYQVPVFGARTVTLRDRNNPDWKATATVEHPGPHTIVLNREARVGDRRVFIEKLTVGPLSTQVTYSAPREAGDPNYTPVLTGAHLDGRPMPVNPTRLTAGDRVVATFGSLRPGARDLTLYFMRPATIVGTAVLTLHQPDSGVSVSRRGLQIEAVVRMHMFRDIPPSSNPYFTDSKGRIYVARMLSSAPTLQYNQFLFAAQDVPYDVELQSLTIPQVLELHPPTQVSLDLSTLMAR